MVSFYSHFLSILRTRVNESLVFRFFFLANSFNNSIPFFPFNASHSFSLHPIPSHLSLPLSLSAHFFCSFFFQERNSLIILPLLRKEGKRCLVISQCSLFSFSFNHFQGKILWKDFSSLSLSVMKSPFSLGLFSFPSQRYSQTSVKQI